MLAVESNNNPEVISLLLDAGSDPNARDEFGSTPLMVGVWAQDNPVVALLLEAGADLDARDGVEGWTPLMVAAMMNENQNLLRVLLDAGADLEGRDESGRTALMLAVALDAKPDNVRVLLDWVFRRFPATDSEVIRPPVPTLSGH